ncbi:MAG: hypothetical protein ACAI35_09710 [Candidatus Methylacidiphilales bacterium]|nr:hypothetical protein [Candidatus Methylacidiphilales bacterium]
MPSYHEAFYAGVVAYFAYLSYVNSRRSNLFLNSRYQVLASPPPMFPRWEDELRRRETELYEMGFYHLVFYHNETYTKTGWPNFNSVFISPDFHTVVEIQFLLKPHSTISLKKLNEANGHDMSALEFTTPLEGPSWVISSEDRHGAGDVPWPESVYVRKWQTGKTLQQAYDWHQASVIMSPFSHNKPVQIRTLEDFQQMDRVKNLAITSDKKKCEWV